MIALLLLLVDVLRQAFEFFQKHECPMRRDLEAFSARLTDEVVIDADQVILRSCRICTRSRSSAPDGICAFFVRRSHLIE